MSLSAPPAHRRESALELAIFQVGAGRYAVPAQALLEAVPLTGLVRTPSNRQHAVGLLEVQRAERPRLVQVMCGRQLFGLHYPPRATDGVVLVLRSPQMPELAVLGLRVDEVLSALETDRSSVSPPPAGVSSFAPWVCGVLDCEVSSRQGKHRALVQVLDVERLLAQWLPFGSPGTVPATAPQPALMA
jgi:chemotaxis signal transduction protein